MNVNNDNIGDVFSRLEKAYLSWNAPVISFMAQVERNPFKLLIATLISLRTKDEVTSEASKRLFARAPDVASLAEVPEAEIAKLIYPAGFYKTKAKNIRKVCRILIEQYAGRVPDEIDVLLELPGVGRKTANLVVAEGYKKPGICVDTHVHRISNRWGYVRSKTPDETETRLRKKLPLEYWPHINKYLVALGQTICKPVSPICSTCLLMDVCPRQKVKVSR